ncbi:MAG: DUF4397 domain-containing protein [Thermomicrobiales bacterium]
MTRNAHDDSRMQSLIGLSRRDALRVFTALFGAAAVTGIVTSENEADARNRNKKQRRRKQQRRRRRRNQKRLCPNGDKTLTSIRVVHASPDAPNVDVYVDGALAIQNLAFGEATDLLPIPAGTRNIQVTPAGVTTPVVIDADVAFDACKAYEVSATGFLTGSPSIGAQVYEIDRNSLGKKTTRVRAIHNSPDAPPVKVFVAGSATPLFDTFSFPNATPFAEVPEGTYDLEIRVASDNALVLAIPGVPLTGRTVVDFFAIGSAATPPDGAGFAVLPLTTPV